MLPYYLLVGVPAVLALINRIINIKYPKLSLKQLVIGSFFAGFLAMLFLRSATCGIDLENYKIFFDFSHYRPFDFVLEKHGIELGYHTIEYLVALLTDNFQIFIGVIACISVVPIWIMYAKESDMPLMSIALFLSVAPFTLYFSALRQVAAMAFAVPAYYFAKNKKPALFILTVIIASLIHSSAIFMIVFYPIYNVRITKNWLYFVVPTMGVMFIFNKPIFAVLLRFFGGKYMDRYSYMESKGGAYMFLVMLVVLAALCFIVTKDTELDRDTVGLRNILLLSVCLQCFASVHPLAMRMNYYFLIFVPILIPKIIKGCRKDTKQLVSMISVCICAFFIFWFFFDAHTGEDTLRVFPYIPFWR